MHRRNLGDLRRPAPTPGTGPTRRTRSGPASGDEDQLALDYVDRLSRELSNEMDWAIMSPALDPIRCEPRFVAVVKRLKTFDPYAAKVCEGKR